MNDTAKPKIWVPGDWNALFGFGTNILVNLLVLTGLLRFVLKMPDSLVFGRILPATGLMLCLSTIYYAWLAYQLAKKTGRTDVCWFGGVRYYKGIPAGLVAIAVGCLIAWGSTAFGLEYGGMSLAKLHDSVSNFGFTLPLPAFTHLFSGFEYLGVILVTAIPFGIYDLVEALDNVESAAVAGDSFPTTRVLTADGVVSLIGCLMGNPFVNAVYIGHPGWKSMGGRIGYSAATGIMVILFAWLGIISVMSALIPVVAISPILLYATLSFFGLMHGEKIGIGESPVVALSYVMVALVLGACAKLAVTMPKTVEAEEDEEFAGLAVE
ncbi:MAG: regulator [Chthoniobacteraceae bacterium]|nr:regulator [Chthoniobacteraceae bacterium]